VAPTLSDADVRVESVSRRNVVRNHKGIIVEREREREMLRVPSK